MDYGKLGEQIAKEIFLKNYSLVLEKIPVEKREQGKTTADFLVKKDGKTIAVAEIKAIELTDLSEKNGYKKLDTGPWTKKDNLPARVGDKIYQGYAQLKNYSYPKILVLVNFSHANVMDLDTAITGGLFYRDKDGNREFILHAPEVANGRIKNIKRDIDIYAWIDGESKTIKFRQFGGNGRADEISKNYF